MAELLNTFLLSTTDLTPLPSETSPVPPETEATPEKPLPPMGQEDDLSDADSFIEAEEGNILDLPMSILMMEGILMQIGNTLDSNVTPSTLCFATGFSRADSSFQIILVPSENGNPLDDPRDDPDLYETLVEFLSHLYVSAEKGVTVTPEELSIEAPDKLALFATLEAFIDDHETLKTQENIGFNYDPDVKDQQLQDMFGHAAVLGGKLMEDPEHALQLFLNLENRPYNSQRDVMAHLTYVNTVDVCTPLSHVIKAIIREDGLKPSIASDKGYHFGTMN